MDYLEFRKQRLGMQRSDELMHYGVIGMHWGVRKYQDANGNYTEEGKKRFIEEHSKSEKADKEKIGKHWDSAVKREMERKIRITKTAKMKTSTLLAGRLGAIVLGVGGMALAAKGMTSGNKTLSKIGGISITAGTVVGKAFELAQRAKEKAQKQYVDNYVKKP